VSTDQAAVAAAKETIIVEALARVARPIIRRTWRPDSCVASTRVGLDVLKAYGVQARPWACMAQVWNPTMVAAVNRGLPAEAAQLEPGAWSVGIGMADDQLGHLVIVTPTWIVDLSIDQASRPDRDMGLPTRGIIAPRTQGAVITADGIFIAWREASGQAWRSATDWTARRRRRGPVREVMRAMKAELEGVL
jgi:hypothetical protein